MTLAVTAASGKLGRSVLRALGALNLGRPVVGLARTPHTAQGQGVDIRPGDFDLPEQLEASLRGVERLLMISTNQDPAARITQHRNVLGAARRAGVARIVFTSVQGIDGAPANSVGASFLRTEADVKASGLTWALGRNGVYIEPDLEAMAQYAAQGEIANSAGTGRCGYTTRAALGAAYAQLLSGEVGWGQTSNLHGTPLTQAQLARHLSTAFDVPLIYRPMEAQAYLEDRIAALGPMLGPIIAGIYDTIRTGGLDNPSHYRLVTGHPHPSWEDFFASLSQPTLRGSP